jgi:hypothetical protein
VEGAARLLEEGAAAGEAHRQAEGAAQPDQEQGDAIAAPDPVGELSDVAEHPEDTVRRGAPGRVRHEMAIDGQRTTEDGNYAAFR